VQIHPDARRSVLVDLLTVYGAGGKAIVFANTKRDADEVSAAIANSMPTEVCTSDADCAQDSSACSPWHSARLASTYPPLLMAQQQQWHSTSIPLGMIAICTQLRRSISGCLQLPPAGAAR
jgi:hypothetical protein